MADRVVQLRVILSAMGRNDRRTRQWRRRFYDRRPLSGVEARAMAGGCGVGVGPGVGGQVTVNRGCCPARGEERRKA
eukprot:scaffold12007_cov42-Cyclotella_meneghiniana.AAC.13